MTELEALAVIEEALDSLQEDYSYENHVHYNDLQAAGYLTNDTGLEITINGEKFILTISKR